MFLSLFHFLPAQLLTVEGQLSGIFNSNNNSTVMQVLPRERERKRAHCKWSAEPKQNARLELNAIELCKMIEIFI